MYIYMYIYIYIYIYKKKMNNPSKLQSSGANLATRKNMRRTPAPTRRTRGRNTHRCQVISTIRMQAVQNRRSYGPI